MSSKFFIAVEMKIYKKNWAILYFFNELFLVSLFCIKTIRTEWALTHFKSP